MPVWCTMGSGGSALASFSETKLRRWRWVAAKDEFGNDIPCDDSVHVVEEFADIFGAASGNWIQYKLLLIDFAAYESSASFSWDGTGGFGYPTPLKFFPDGTQILEAKAELSVSGLTRSYRVIHGGIRNCDDTAWIVEPYSPGTVTTIENTSFSVLGFNGPNDYEVVGEISGHGDGQQVHDITWLIQLMMDNRDSAKYALGFTVVPSPTLELADGGLSLLYDEGPYADVPECSGPCMGVSLKRAYVELKDLDYTWGGISFGNVTIKVQYPTEDKERTLIHQRFPSMREVVPAGFKRYEDGTLAPL